MRSAMFAGSVLIAMLLLAGCPPPQETAPSVDVAAEAQAIRDLSAQWLAWSQAKDAAAIADEILLEDATTIFDGEVHEGRAAIRADIEAGYAENPDATIVWRALDVKVAASGDLAYERGAWTYDPDADGEQPEENGEYVTVWKKVDGAWRVAVDAGTTIKSDEE